MWKCWTQRGEEGFFVVGTAATLKTSFSQTFSPTVSSRSRPDFSLTMLAVGFGFLNNRVLKITVCVCVCFK